jgi:hypothetical protein
LQLGSRQAVEDFTCSNESSWSERSKQRHGSHQFREYPGRIFLSEFGAFSHETDNHGTSQRVELNGVDAHGAIPGLDAMFQQSFGNEQWEANSWVDTMLNDQGLMDDSLFGLFTSAQPYL